MAEREELFALSNETIHANWNPWHGCTKLSAGCKNCYVYRQDKSRGSVTASNECRKTASFGFPISRKRDGSYRLASGSLVYTCFTSDFLLKDADEWRPECWNMMRERRDCRFYFFTKRIDRLCAVLPPDWNDGYENVMIGCTVENQAMADYRLPIFRDLPIKHKSIIVEPLLEHVELSNYLDETIEEVAVGGESGYSARECDFDWVRSLRNQCVLKNVNFWYHQTGAFLVKDGKSYRIPRGLQLEQARKANVDFERRDFLLPKSEWEHEK